MKSRYRRVKYSVNAHVAQELAKRGVEGKRNKDDPEVRANEASKQPLSYLTKTRVLDRLLGKSQSIFTKTCSFKGPSYDEHMLPDLARYAFKLRGPTVGDPWIKFLKTFLGTHLGKWCSLLSDLATELAISMKQHCQQGQMVLKPTNSGSSLFYSILSFRDGLSVDPSSAGTVFKQDFQNQHVQGIEFNSVNFSKLLNLVKRKSMVFTLLSYWIDFYGIHFWEQDLSEESETMKQV